MISFDLEKFMSVYLLVLLQLCAVLCKAELIQCSSDSKCPESSPCCSQFGFCGVGSLCLGGCDPLSSFNLSSCLPQPVCRGGVTSFTSLDSIAHEDTYKGDASTAGWTSIGRVLQYKDSALLTLGRHSTGTVLSSTRPLWYGKVSAAFKASHGRGIVSAFILMSNKKDEIDFEILGVDPTQAQTNYYSLGRLDYTHSMNVSLEGSSHSSDGYHLYEIDWSPNAIKWSVDGVVARTIEKSETYNAQSGKFEYPQTPARVQLSIWPAGSDDNASGTVAWAGGSVDWNMPEFDHPGYLYVSVKNITIECYNKSMEQSDSAYAYRTEHGGEESVYFTNEGYTIGSQDGVGFNRFPTLDSQDDADLNENPTASTSSRAQRNGRAASAAQSRWLLLKNCSSLMILLFSMIYVH